MKSTIKLFKAVPITAKKKKKASKVLLEKTIKRGFIFAPEVISNYSDKELAKLIILVVEEIGLTPEKLTNTFHKSWKKVKEASIEQLIIEQIVHYFTTYGYEALGIKGDVFIPHEKLEIPEIDSDGINITIIRGYTKKELKEKLLNMLSSGIALKEETIKDVLEVCEFVKITGKDIDNIKNPLKGFLTVLHEIDEYSLRRDTFGKIDVIIQPVHGIPVQEVEHIRITYPHGSGFGIQMADLPGLNV